MDEIRTIALDLSYICSDSQCRFDVRDDERPKGWANNSVKSPVGWWMNIPCLSKYKSLLKLPSGLHNNGERGDGLRFILLFVSLDGCV